MSADRANDQADGLRRMFSAERLRVIHVVAGCPGDGRGTVAVNLGIALARAGRETLLIDVVENRQRRTALDYLPRDSRRHRDAGSVSVAGPHGLAILSLDAAAAQAPARAAQVARQHPSLHYALITDSTTRCGRWLPIEDARRDLIVVLTRGASSITDAYALVKRMNAAGVSRRFHILINRAGSEAEAAMIFRNMSGVARGYLDVDLDLLGFIPADPQLEQAAARWQSLLDAAPDAPAAKAFVRLANRIAAWSLAPTLDRARRDVSHALGAA